MTRRVRVVTDSTSDIPRAVASSLGIEVVPLSVRFGDEAFLDGVELSPGDFLQRLQVASELPKTSQPPTTAFEAVFRRALDADEDVLCLTIASNLSGTYNAARLAAEATAGNRVRVVDSGTVTMHLGWAAVEAARAAQAGDDLAAVTAAADSALGRAKLFAVLETLDYVYKGGRIGRASQLVGSMLNIKPILSVRAGEVVPLERVRTWRKALDRLVDLARAQAPLVEISVLHMGNAADAEAVASRLSDLLPEREVLLTEAGPVIATYAGPGAVGVAVLKG
jgi:DegV family protein with EDD domain